MPTRSNKQAPAVADEAPEGGALRQISLLWLLAQADQPLTLNEVALALQAPRSSVHRLLHSLVGEGWVIGSGRPKRYAPSWKVVELGFQVARKHRARQVLVDAAIDLAAVVQSPVFLGFYERGDMLYTDYIDVRGERVLLRLIATRFPAVLTAYGRVALAYQPGDEVDRALRPDLTQLSRRPVPSRADLERVLSRIREQGYDVSQRGRDPGILGVAVPVFEGPNLVVAALGVRLQDPQRDESHQRVLGPALSAAQQAAADLRYEPSLFP
jgi:DNA-binding IclR family transcriptional regulator